MSGHTQTPWTMQIVRPGDKKIEITGHMAYGYGFVAMIPRDDCDHDEAKANARLIAAAPDLLEAAKAIDLAIYAIREDLSTQFPALAEAWGQCRVAIYKAEGR